MAVEEKYTHKKTLKCGSETWLNTDIIWKGDFVCLIAC